MALGAGGSGGSSGVFSIPNGGSPLLLTGGRFPSLLAVKEKLTADPDSEVATTSLRVSLMCPVGWHAPHQSGSLSCAPGEGPHRSWSCGIAAPLGWVGREPIGHRAVG